MTTIITEVEPGDLVVTEQNTETFVIEENSTPDLIITELGTPGPQGTPGPKGDKGDTGSIGDVNAVSPIIYDHPTNTISIDGSVYDSAGAASTALSQAQSYANAIKSARAFIFTQNTSSSLWIINHNLNTKPNVTVLDSANQEVFGDIIYVDNNTLTVGFRSAFSGTAYLI